MSLPGAARASLTALSQQEGGGKEQARMSSQMPAFRGAHEGKLNPSQEAVRSKGILPLGAAFHPPALGCLLLAFLAMREPGPAGSQDGLSDDTNEAVWPLGLHSLGPPLGSWPPRRDKGAQVPAALQVQQAGLPPRGLRVGPASAGLQRGHYLWENEEGGRG